MNAFTEGIVGGIIGLIFGGVYNHAFPREDEAAGPTEVELLTEIRDELRRR